MIENGSSTKRTGLRAALADYWSAYGGAKKLFTSPFLGISLPIWIAIAPLWWENGFAPLVISILPCVLGFSITSFTMLLAIGDERFRHWLSVRPSKNKHARIFGTTVAFFHFILMQLIAILLAIVLSAKLGVLLLSCVQHYGNHPSVVSFLNAASKCMRGLSALIAIYSLVLTLAAILHLFRLTRLYTSFSTMVSKTTNASPDDIKSK